MLIEKYECYDMRLPRILQASRPCEFEKLENFYASIDHSECFEQCPFECETVNYDFRISTSKFKVKNVAAISITYDALSYTEISYSASLSAFDLIANIGGTLGLFMGLSILSIVEIVELGFSILLGLCFATVKTKLTPSVYTIQLD